MAESTADSAIAIVGVGAIFPGAADADTFWRNIVGGVDSISEVPADRWDPAVYYDPDPAASGPDRFYTRRGGFVDDLAVFDPIQFGIMPASVAGAEPDQLLALRTAAAAIEDAGGQTALPEDRSRVGVVVGRGGYLTPGCARLDQRVRTAHQLTTVLAQVAPELGPGRLAEIRRSFQAALGPAAPEAAIGLVPNFTASRVANRFDLGGPAYTVDAACASSLIAVEHAVRELSAGRCDAVLAGGVHHCHHTTLWSVFTQLRALSPTGTIRPFDRGADGTLLSEGTGMVLLKRLADAEAAGDRVYAVIQGVGVASDGRAASMMNPAPAGQALAIGRAWQQAGIDPAGRHALGLIEAHGTGTPVGDGAELRSLLDVFGPSGGQVGLGTVKSMIGHAMPAAGIAGLIKAALALHHRVLPPTLHVTQPHPLLAGTRFELLAAAQPWEAAGDQTRRAGVNAFGFGGINAHVVLAEAPAGRTTSAPVVPPRSFRAAPDSVAVAPGPSRAAADSAAVAPGPFRAAPDSVAVAPGPSRPAGGGEPVLLLAGADPADLARQLARPDPELLAAASTVAPPADAGPCRLALVAPDARRLRTARKVVDRGQPWRGRGDLWFTPQPLRADPSAGPDGGRVAFLYPGFEPTFEPALTGVAEHCGLAPAALTGGAELIERGLDVVTTGRLLTAALGELDVVPDALAGHSVGEWTAMVVGGVYPGIDAFLDSLRPGMIDVPDVGYLAVGAGADRVAQLVAGAADLAGLVVTHDNCPHQSVLCGPSDRLDRAIERFREAGVLAQTMPFKTGFHSPMMEPHLDSVRNALAGLEVTPAALPLWSATTLEPFPTDPAAIRKLVVRHLLEPVRFQALTQRLHGAGIRVFVQVGPGSLTGFIGDTLARAEHLAVAANDPRRGPAGGLAQLRRVAAALWVEGWAPRFDRLPPTEHSPTTQPASAQPASAQPASLRPAAGAARQGVRLRLGDPLVRLSADAVAGLRAAPTPVPATAPPPASRPAPPASRPAPPTRRPGPPPPPTGPAAPPRPPAPAPRTLRRDQVFSLATMPEVVDHCVMPQAPGWPEAADQFPVVPLTGLLEVMADAARELCPGRIVTGFETVTAGRWVTAAPPTTATIRATGHEASPQVLVEIDGYTRGVVRLSDAVVPPPATALAPLANPRPAPVSAEALYRERWMFHGPRFAGVTDIERFGDNGLTGTITVLPAPGALLDAAGQLIGHWVQASQVVDRTVLPTGIDAITFHGPTPPPGTELSCEARITGVTASQVRADAEITGPDGAIWCRITGWTTRRFACTDRIWDVTRRPDLHTLSEPRPDGWVLVREDWADAASRDMMARRYLTGPEFRQYAELTPRDQRQWLLGRIAAKDAVRNLLGRRGAGPLYPAEVSISGSDRRMQASGAFRRTAVALALAGGERPSARGAAVGVALAGLPSDGPLGIALQRVDATGVPDAAERALLDQFGPGAAGDDDQSWWLAAFRAATAAAHSTLPADPGIGDGDGDGGGAAYGVRVNGVINRPGESPGLTVAVQRTPQSQPSELLVQTTTLREPTATYLVAWAGSGAHNEASLTRAHPNEEAH